jgi:hypothetical protein
MSLHYYMDHDIFIDRGDLFSRPVRATLYRGGFRPVIVERPFGELQIF